MQIAAETTQSREASNLTTLDEVRMLVEDLIASRHGTMRLCDALMTVATELALTEAGRGGTAAWLERVAADIRTGRQGLAG